MKLIAKYRSNDPETTFSRLTVLFDGMPVVISWDKCERTVNGYIVTITLSGLHYEGTPCSPEPVDFDNIKHAGGMWFDKSGRPYGSSVEILSLMFMDDKGKKYPATVREGVTPVMKGGKPCGTQ